MKSDHRFFIGLFVFMLLGAGGLSAEDWRVTSGHDQRQGLPGDFGSFERTVKPGDSWPNDSRFRWMVADLVIPAEIDGQAAAGKGVGLRFNCGDGGEVYVNGQLSGRYDNDHPAMALISRSAQPGTEVQVAAQVYGKVQGGDRFGEASWAIISPELTQKPLVLSVDAATRLGRVPDGIVGLSQGGMMADYEEATARKLAEGGFKWFRMDNILTQAVKEIGGELVYDWEDLDRRVDFINSIGAVPILAVSYMPQVFDAIENHDRQSAPRDYRLWEELCYQAARRCMQRGHRVPFWEVWNEPNTGWIKPGPEDTGSDAFRKMYEEAVGKPVDDHGAIRTFEAYCKLYRATARGVLRADPAAKIGGPALASGPFEFEEYGFCRNGKGFAKGLMLWCRKERLPLDFVSWHEYFHPADVLEKEVQAFRGYLSEFPELKARVQSFMITEWNEAWWANRPQDHEVGAAYCADCITRVFIPRKVDRPCFFYVKQGDMNFRGDFSMLMQNNTPKASYNVLKMFNSLSGEWLRIDGGDEDISAVASWDAQRRRLTVILVNFRYRYSMERDVRVELGRLPSGLHGGHWKQWVVDATHSNVWNDRSKAELEMTAEGEISRPSFEVTMGPNAVVMFELMGQ